MAVEEALGQLGERGFLTGFEKILSWARKYSLWPLPFGTACCAIEFMAAVGTHYDISRYGWEVVRFSPRQADLMIVAGTVNYKIAPALMTVYEQMLEPKWVIAMGACATCGGFYNNYSVVQGVDRIIPVDAYVPGCPPKPEALIDGIFLIKDMIEKGTKRARDAWEKGGRR
ncbi:MAG: NADH-quinone oxidoreductase subunit B [Deltaproteobacteria bacterium]|nr:NADH-quinone oxidoreductase subunit B [Deltaproteobacteria bacterium]NIS76135.1 NADH-quinone oxidoreductase subunit B [Deltaproteobacteria bacterium]